MNWNQLKKIVVMGVLAMTCFSMQVDAVAVPLAKKKCVPCSMAIPVLNEEALIVLQEQLHSDWKIVDEHHLERVYEFEDFASALEFTVAVGIIAEEEGHHPDILLSYGRVKVMLWTHKSNGLTESDFIVAARVDSL